MDFCIFSVNAVMFLMNVSLSLIYDFEMKPYFLSAKELEKLFKNKTL